MLGTDFCFDMGLERPLSIIQAKATGLSRKDQERVRQTLATLHRMIPMRPMRRPHRVAFMKRPAYADALAMQFSAMIDGLAIQVLLNDTVMTPQRMYDICLDVAQRLIASNGQPS
jgi:hypothetical protein